MPFAAICTDLEIVILSEVREGEISYDCPYMQNLNEIIQMNLQNRNRLTDIQNKLTVWQKPTQHCKAIVLQLKKKKKKTAVTKGEGAEGIGSLGLRDTHTVYKIGSQQGPAAQHREFYSISYDKP